MDFACRKFRQFPRSGDWFSQDDYEMKAMNVAHRSYDIHMKQKHGTKWDLADAEFVAWLEGDD